MEVRVTSLTTNYNHTIPMNAGRELEQEGRTVHLRSLDVTCSAETADRERTQFEFHWVVDQEQNDIELATVETPNDDSAPADRLNAAAELADDVVHEFLVDVGLDMTMTNALTTPGVQGRANVFADLEVNTDV
jgi:hypothetical protein